MQLNDLDISLRAYRNDLNQLRFGKYKLSQSSLSMQTYSIRREGQYCVSTRPILHRGHVLTRFPEMDEKRRRLDICELGTHFHA